MRLQAIWYNFIRIIMIVDMTFFSYRASEKVEELKLADEAETDMICSAIYHHDDKLVTDSPMDEVVKDADVIHHCMNDLSRAIKEKEQARYDKLCAEFGML